MLGDVDMSPEWSLISYKCQLSKGKTSLRILKNKVNSGRSKQEGCLACNNQECFQMLKIHPKSGETWWQLGWARSWWHLVRPWEYGVDSLTDHTGAWNRRVKVDWVFNNIHRALFHCLKSGIKYGKVVALFSIKVGGPWVCLLFSAPIGMSEIGDDSQCLEKRIPIRVHHHVSW